MQPLTLILLALLALAALPVRGEVRAVVIGVGDYQHLDADLKGPPQDAALIADVLIARGVAPGSMQVLGAVRVPPGAGTGAPTRAGIEASMALVAAQSRPGDTVVFYFSGHGAQVPDVSGDEGGGSDEALLPADARRVAGGIDAALVDDTLQVWAAGLLSRGVAVVGLVDACHSATGFRSPAGSGVARGLAVDLPGLPEAGEAGQIAGGLSGDFVFLYSSQSDQRSFEYPLGDTGLWHGEFTLRLAQVLRDAPSASWRQVLAATGDAMLQGPARQMPEGEGPLLDAGVFGRGAGTERFAVEAGGIGEGGVGPGGVGPGGVGPGGVGPGRIAAGLLQGLVAGSDVAFYAAAAGGDPLGLAVLGEVGLRQAVVPGGVPAGARWAEVVALPPPPALRLAPAVRADGRDYAAWEAALAAGAADTIGSGPVDLVPILTGGVVALAGADGVLDPVGPGSTPRIVARADETPGDAVARVLEQAGHALRLRAVLAGAAGRSLTGGPGLEVGYARQPGCAEGERAPVDPGQGLRACDKLWITVTNRAARPVDLSILYFNADFSVAPIWPQRGLANRLAPGETARAGLQIAPDSGFAQEELFVLGVPVDPDAPRVDLTRLAAPSMSRGFASASGSAVMWFLDRMDPVTARGFTAKPALVLVRQMVRVRPPE